MTLLLPILLVPAAATLIALASRRLAPWVTLLGALAVLALASDAALHVSHGGILRALNGGLALDPLGALYLLLVAFVGVTAALFSIGYLPARAREQADAGEPPRYRQYYPLFNIFLASMLAVPLVANIAVIWIAIELTTIFSAFLVAYENRAEALEAAWKYVVLTSMGAMIALFGVLVLYYGIHHEGQPVTWHGLALVAPHLQPAVLLITFVLWLVGFGAKAGLVPLHTWLPDAHSQAPASICALLSGVETSAALYMLLRIYPALVANPGIARPGLWYLVAGLITVGTAAFLLLQVQDYKRLFAYSTIEHMGIILTACGLGAGVHELGTVYQFFAHAFTKSFCFYAAGLATIVFATQDIASVGGLLARSPVVGGGLLLGAVAIAGAPPFALFISEFEILRTGFAAGQYLATGLLTAFIVLAFVAITYQVGRVVFGEPAGAGAHVERLPASGLAALGVAFVPVLVFGFYLPPALASLVHQAALLLGGGA
ncbi:MAG TPA: proton-conducting transporter membrane subunit [Gammaproteobacteria bacterium]|nr:proton-conducting transporter membrane subunit [Gammaproteobacteria bacterium]